MDRQKIARGVGLSEELFNTASCGVEVVPFAIGSSLPAYPAGTLHPMNVSGTPETGILHSATKTYFPGLQA